MNTLEMVAKDSESNISFNIVNNGVITNVIELDLNLANAAQNIFKKEAENLKLPSESDNMHRNQLMTFFQTRDVKSKVGNKAVIDAISSKPLNVVFDNNRLKCEILDSESNPHKKAYLVDVVIQTIHGNPVAYKVTKLNDVLDLE